MSKTGVYEILGDIHYFIPHALPPAHPPFVMTQEISEFYQKALKSVEMLTVISKQIPDQKRFIKSYIIKEALLSSAIEGIHTTLIDVFTYPQNISFSKINKNTQLVVNYIQALDIAMTMMSHDNLPISSRVICAAH